jgi:hypothetical protein
LCLDRTYSGAEAIQHRVLIYVLAFRLQPENGSTIAARAATLLSPAKR